ncbi:MAG: hypothetical protein ACFFDP_12955 [Promethearchaeota archaeon]
MRHKENSTEICMNRSKTECSDCVIKEHLECHFRSRTLLRFSVTFLIAAVPAIAAMILAGYGLFLLGWLAFAILFLQIWENKILCSHCPVYARKGKTLRCHANYGLHKIWKFNPKPMSQWEKIQFVIGASIFSSFPVPFLLLGNQYLLLFTTLVGISIFWGVLLVKMCVRCVNFSCPLNRVPKHSVDAFLAKNPVMREAWEETGYKLEDVTE